MNITCANCSTNFIVSDEKIGILGRKVKCTKCLHIWHQELVQNYSPSPERGDFLLDFRATNLPVIIPQKANQLNYHSLFLVLTTVSLIMLLFYNKFNLTSKLDVKQIHITTPISDAPLSLKYNITNRSKTKLKLPLLRIRLLDIKNNVIAQYVTELPVKEINYNENIFFKTNFDKSYNRLSKIDFTLGNRLEFLIR